MRTLLLTFCAVALLAGCSDDKTDDGSPVPVVGKAQFAAAVDDFAADTRISIADGMTTWEAGDRVGITAMIDGTPYIQNVPYEFAASTSFGELMPVDEPIVWNEAVTGERSFFACWPYKPSDDGYTTLDCARFGFSVPAVQTMTADGNTAKPVLIGSAVTTATTQRPIALRFKNLFSVINLRFAPFAETAIRQIVIEPAADASFEGYLAVSGTVTSKGEMIVEEQADRIAVECPDGLDLNAGASLQVPVGRFTVTGGLKFTATTDDGRTFSDVVFADEPWCSYVADASGAFLKARYVSHTMQLNVISDEVADGKVYFEDDLNWISASTRWDGLTGGGWPTVTAAGSATGKANYFTVDLIPDFATKGYVQSVNRTSVQARYEGYLCLGTTSAQGALITPKLAKIGDTPTDILVSFYGATYASEGLMADNKPMTIKVLGAGTIGDQGAVSAEVEIPNYYGWHKFWIIVKDATAATQIQFGQDVAASVGRVLLDNILIGKAVKGAIAGDRAVVVADEPFIHTLDNQTGVNYAIENVEKATGVCFVQSNQPWVATTEADWITITPSNEYNGTGMAYKITVTAQSVNTTGKTRSAEVSVTAGELTQTLTFTQTGEIPEKVILDDDFSWTLGDGSRGGIPIPGTSLIASTTAIGTNGTKFDKWSTKDYLKYGWTSPVNDYAYAKDGMLGFGIVATPGGVVSPAFAQIGSVPMDVVAEFDILEYKNADEVGKTVFAIYAGGGEIASFTGHYTSVPGDTFTKLSDDKRTQNFYCGNYGGWTNGAYWHHVVVEIRGATSDTQVQLQGPGANCRFWLDNFKVTQKK